MARDLRVDRRRKFENHVRMAADAVARDVGDLIMRYLLIIIAALALSGCAGMDIAGNQITQAQAQYLATQDARAAREAEASKHVVDAIAGLANSQDQTSRIVGLMMLDRVLNGTTAVQKAVAPMPQQEGPITTALRVVAPFVLPLAQIWQADRAGARSLQQSYANMNLIGQVAGQIQRDPLVVTTPSPTVIQAPDPVIVQTPNPLVIDRPTPIVIDQPVIVPVATHGG